ncbi:di-heme oxidoredictase family protein [Sulfurimonas sp. HSL3-7]|uniref:di-heme oxidoreductase family protein n=1 Tax=Sulfonitrofixus jiaomeiensis TaxID=3131938 RepID=UPI0031F8FFD9
MKTILPMALAALLAAGCSDTATEQPERDTLAENHYTQESGKKAFSHAIGGMDGTQTDLFVLGKSFFRIPWVEAPSATTARDGLGPLFSANTCKNCHPANGAGTAVNERGEINRSLVMRLSLKHAENINNGLEMQNEGFLPEPHYGGQLSVNGIFSVPFEGKPEVTYKTVEGRYGDGETFSLRAPAYRIDSLNYGPLHPQANIAPHIALALIGLGAIERIDADDILKHEDINDSDNDGISGKANWVYSPETKKMELGRFTWKASAPSVRYQTANAMSNDMGLTTPLFPKENCTESQKECNEAASGRDPFDVPQGRLDAVAFYISSLRIPKQREMENKEEAGELFRRIGCTGCHVESYTTADGLHISPYSDFLLHDMGEALSDGHRNFRAGPNEFRTPPLWGAGLYKTVGGEANYLHDGRARSIEEAILWHGGEAAPSREAFKHLTKEERALLLAYIGVL